MPILHKTHVYGSQQNTYLGDSRVLTTLSSGELLILDTQDLATTPHMLAHGVWEQDTTRFLRSYIKPGMQICEVGSNIGYFTILMSSLVGEKGYIHAFEPNPRTLSFLKTNVDINNRYSKIHIYSSAISNVEGTTSLHVLKKHAASGSILKLPQTTLTRRFDECESISVPVTTLDVSLKDKKIDFIKIDAEGSELEILEGAKETISRNKELEIICEFNKELLALKNISHEEFLTRISAPNFTPYIVSKKSITKIHTAADLEPYEVVDIYLARTKK